MDVICIANTSETAEVVIMELVDAGFRKNDVSVLLSRGGGLAGCAPPRGAVADVTDAELKSVLGGAVELLAGKGALFASGIGRMLGAGPLLFLLGGAPTTLARVLIGMGMSDRDAVGCERQIELGAIAIAVHVRADEQRRRAESIMRRNGAGDVASLREERRPRAWIARCAVCGGRHARGTEDGRGERWRWGHAKGPGERRRRRTGGFSTASTSA